MLYFDPAVLTYTFLTLTEGSTDHAKLAYPAIRDATTAKYFLYFFRTMTDQHGGHSEIEGGENLLLLLARLVEHRNDPLTEIPKAIEQARAHRR